jgi:uncharacterized protein (DUF2235 family)
VGDNARPALLKHELRPIWPSMRSKLLQPGRHFLYLVDGTGLNAGKSRALDCYSNVYNLNIYVETHNINNEANIAFYFSGVASASTSTLGSRAAGIGLNDLIQQVYVNICSNFNGGDEESTPDKLYLFGFSRGAFVVQSVCRLIDEYGLLHADRINLFNELYRHWLGEDKTLDKEAFTEDNCWNAVSLEFVGLFDSVFGVYNEDRNSPLLRPAADKDRQLPAVIKTAAHLLSIDEGRRYFAPYLWKGISKPGQTLLQIWMPGNHSDVGGGYSEDLLSAIALRRMLELVANNTSLKLDRDRVPDLDALIRRDCVQDNKRHIHDERFSAVRKLRPMPRRHRSEFISKEHLLDPSAVFLNRKFVIRGRKRTQYLLPNDWLSLPVLETLPATSDGSHEVPARIS